MKKIHDLYISLGADYSTYEVLKKSHLQFFSFPFDRVFGASMFDRAKIFENKFKDWLNQEDLELIKNFKSPVKKDCYKNKKTNLLYLRDFDYNTPLSKSYAGVAERYNKDIQNLSKLLETAHNICFVYIDTPVAKKLVCDSDLIKMLDSIRDKYRTININILYLYNIHNVPFDQRKTTNVTENIVKIGFDYNKYNPENESDVDINALCKVFADYHITFKFVSVTNQLIFVVEKFKKLWEKIYFSETTYTGGKKVTEQKILGVKI